MIAALALSLFLGAAAPPDVGIVFRSAAGTSGLLTACPRIAVVETSVGGGDLLRGFFDACPTGAAVVQLPPVTFLPALGTAADAQFQAARYWSLTAPNFVAPLQLTPGTRAATWVAGPPDFETFPSWRSDPTCDAAALFCAADFMGVFWAELDRLARADGFRGLVLPPFSPRPGDRADALCRLLQGLDAATAADIAWTWDAVSPGMEMSVADEASTTFGFRDARNTCASTRLHPLLVRLSVAGGWRTRATGTDFLAWLRWLDGAVDADPHPFLGVAVFGFGTGDGNDLAPIASELAAYLVDPTVPPDGGAGGGNGGVAPGTPPPTTPGSNLGPDRGGTSGCSTAGAPALIALVGVAAAMRPRRKPGARGTSRGATA